MSYPINSLRDFYEWVKTREPTETYDYTNRRDCAIALYCKDRGVEYEGSTWEHIGRQYHLEFIAQHSEDNPYPIKKMSDLRMVLERELDLQDLYIAPHG